VERFSIEVRGDALPSLRDAADANGHSVEAELGSLVARTYSKRAEDDWVHALIAMTRPGVEYIGSMRMSWEREIPFEFDDFD